MDKLTARQLYDNIQERLDVRWVAGMRGETRVLDGGENQSRRPSLVGYLNVIYPNKVQIIGSEELAYLDALDSRQRWETIQKIVSHSPLALLVSKSQKPPSDLVDAAEESDTPLWISSKRGHKLLAWLQFHLARQLAQRITLHGVFLEVYSIGVLVTGDPGSGKSELALELITRGHRLVADDATEFTLVSPDVIDGACPELLRDLLEVRGIGVLNVREMFGHTAVKKSKYLRLIVHLKPMRDTVDGEALKRLTGDTGKREIMDVMVPTMTIPVAPGRNLAVMVEAAVRSYMLKSSGIDPSRTFIDRQARQLQNLPPW
ncbi:MAG TPA: HPr(Ser) kinase/phosphatase [Oleiagrimonas sp.]|nr:HPr(Ser) kinase/phosphatase [Oleiagrimonas sp.]